VIIKGEKKSIYVPVEFKVSQEPIF